MISLQVQDKRKSGGQTYALKALVKQHIVETKQQEHVYNEKKILMELDSPFIIRYLSVLNASFFRNYSTAFIHTVDRISFKKNVSFFKCWSHSESIISSKGLSVPILSLVSLPTFSCKYSLL